MKTPIKKLLLSIIVFFSFSSFAQTNDNDSGCAYYMENDSLLYEGYTINYSRAITELMESKNFKRVFDQSYDYELKLIAYEIIDGRFKKAQAQFKLIDKMGMSYLKDFTKTCYTQFCAASDIAKAITKLIRQEKKELKNCQ